jgi:hypothetical protein
MLARIGALNNLCDDANFHRRDALWEVEKAVRVSGPLLQTIVVPDSASPLKRMSVEERLVADCYGVGLTTGPHPVASGKLYLHSIDDKQSGTLLLLFGVISNRAIKCVTLIL